MTKYNFIHHLVLHLVIANVFQRYKHGLPTFLSVLFFIIYFKKGHISWACFQWSNWKTYTTVKVDRKYIHYLIMQFFFFSISQQSNLYILRKYTYYMYFCWVWSSLALIKDQCNSLIVNSFLCHTVCKCSLQFNEKNVFYKITKKCK